MLGLAAAAAGKVVRSVDKQCVSALWPTRARINNVFLPYGRPVGEHWMLNRTLCSKTQEGSAPKPKTGTSGSSFKVPGHKPSDWDKKFLIWTGRFKKVEDIPETVSFEMIDAARNKMRVKISYLMIALTILGCIIMVIAGKRAVARHESLTTQNMEKKARWKEEAAQSASAKP